MGSRAELDAVRARVAAAARQLAAQGLMIGTSGNVSERVGEHVAITATGAMLESVEADGVSVVDRAGRVVHGELEPSSELFLHLGIYDRYGAGAVVHSHAPMATALACVVDEVPCIHYQMLAFGGAVRVAPYRTFGTPELAEATLQALEGKAAALMANHGAIVHGASIDQAVESALLLEWACTLYWRAASIGRPSALDDERQQQVIEAVIARNYGTTRRTER